jgi:hypothetical protein
VRPHVLFLACGLAWSCVSEMAEFEIREAAEYGEDEIAGVLHVADGEAYFEEGGRRIRLIQAPPQTAQGTETLLARTAQELEPLSSAHVLARGDLQGEILWEARVERAR